MHHASFATHVEMLPAKVPTPGAEKVAPRRDHPDRQVQPLVRYVLGDLVQVASPSAITTVEGTLDDCIVRPDGALVTPGAIDRAVGAEPARTRSRRAPRRSGARGHRRQRRRHRGAPRPFFHGLKVSSRAVTAIGVEPNGKYRTSRRTNVPFAIEAVFEGAVP